MTENRPLHADRALPPIINRDPDRDAIERNNRAVRRKLRAEALRDKREWEHTYGRHKDGDWWFQCQQCELTVTVAMRGLTALWPMKQEVPRGFR